MIRALRLRNVRNYEGGEFRPAPSLTVVVGDNASGKSSLLETAGIFSTLSSPRAPSLKLLVRQGCEEGGAKLETVEGASLELKMVGGRVLLRVGASPVAARHFLGRFHAVLFTPEDLDVVRGEPALRRRALDELLVQLRPRYRTIRQEFERALRQRNAALRDRLQEQASLYTPPLAQAAAGVLEARRDVVEQLVPPVRAVYAEISGGGEVALVYRDTTQAGDRTGRELVEYLREVFEQRMCADLERGQTTLGPHRDDLEVTVEGRDARLFASRGEQRSVALAFRLAELRLLPEATLLLDDVLSELDPPRRRRVLEVSSGTQTVVTATDTEVLPPSAKVEAMWLVRSGHLEEGTW